MAPGRRRRVGGSQENAGPSHDTDANVSPTDSPEPTSGNDPVNTPGPSRLVKNVASAVADMVERACALHDEGAEVVNLRGLATSNPFAFRVATMCSGTEAPIFFIKMLMEAFVATGMNDELFRFRHVFSVEKVPYKQAYISRNTDAIVFRDVLDLAGVKNYARTAKGSIAPIPGDIDILIAGTTCVDFSSLNSRKKTTFSKTVVDITKTFISQGLPEAGEERLCMISKVLNEIEVNLHVLTSSEQTFFSMLLYVRNHRPRIVILENVRGAPFTYARDIWFHGLNYAASTVVLDTKECYFPQTRERRYLIAVSQDEFQEADQGVAHFSDIIKKLKRPQPSSVEDFLLEDNDTRAQLARLESEDTARNKNTREVAWDHCHLRHDETRRRDNLGPSRPLTGWKDDGTNNFYDRMDKIIMKPHPHRVLDCVDISHLKSQSGAVPQPYDIRYKTKVLDLSQNIDRQKFKGGFGIVPCITPNGLSWITNQWRFVTGLEALTLQGLPIERINLSRETQTDLLNLAGNAMTTTAVGMVFTAAILCLGGRKLDSGVSLFQSFYGNQEFADLEVPFASTVGLLTPQHGTPTQGLDYSTTEWPENMEQVMAVYKRARRYCCCSGSTKYSVQKTKRCWACSVVRCTNCAGNPIHRFETAKDVGFQPMTFQNTERELTRLLPTVIPSLFKDCHAVDERLLQSPLGAIVDELWATEFFYQRIYVTEAVTVQYASNVGFILHAVIQQEGITWYLFLDRYSELAHQTITPKTWLESHCMRKKPFARCFLEEGSPTSRPAPPQWEFWICPQLQDKNAEFQVLKQSIGGRNRITLQYVNNRNLEDAVNATLQKLAGDYDHYPECESAEDSLHIRKSTNESSQLYLFKDPTRTGPADKDIFVISRENRLLQPHEHRDALVEFAPSIQLHRAGLGISPPAEVVLNGHWEPIRAWCPLPLRQLKLGNEQLFTPACYRDNLGSCRCDDRLLFELKLACPRSADAQTLPMDPQFLLRKLEWVSRGQWAAVPVHQMRNFFETFSFATSKAITLIKKSELIDIPSCRNEECSVRLPQVKWYIPEPKALPEPLHLTGDIDQYETALKKQTPVFQAQFKVCKVSDEQTEIRLRFIGNHARLAHRAEAAMPPERRAILIEPSDIILSAKTQTQRNAPLVFPLRPFQESIQPLEGGADAFVPFSKTGHSLKQEQMLSVQWMLEHEKYPVPFKERESEEEVVEGLQLRLVGTAERSVTRRGGLVADDIGFGKTVMMLAVIQLQRRGDKDHFRERTKQEHHDGRKALESSLVIAPSHIVEQWGDEANRFLGYELDKDVVLVRKLADLRGKQIAKLMKARLIIVSDAIFAMPGYQEPLSFWSGCRYPGLSMPPARYGKWLADRSYTAWHDNCMACVGGFLGKFLQDDSKNSRMLCMQQIHTRHQDAEYENEGLKKHAASNKAEATDDEDGADAAPRAAPRSPLHARGKERMFFEEQFIFEFFSFNRVVWDEVGYSNATVAQFVASVSAVSKWLLSGTPASQNLADVCTYANALGIHLARPIDLREGLPSASRGPSLHTKTRCEMIASYGRLKSDEFVRERHSQGQLFLGQFSSANMVDRTMFPAKHMVVVSSPTLADRAVYQSLQHDISRAEMNADFLSGDCLQWVYAAVGGAMGRSPGRSLAVESLIHAATVPSFAKKAWLSSSSRLDKKDGTSRDGTDKPTFVQAVRRIQARRLFDAKIYIARLFEKLLWLTYRLFVSSHLKDEEGSKDDGKEKTDHSARAIEKASGFLRTIGFLKQGDMEEFGGEDNYLLLVRALFPELPHTNKEILCQAASQDGLRLGFLDDRKIVDFASPPGLQDPLFDFLYATRKTSWCHYYKVNIPKIDELPVQDLVSLLLDFERELHLLEPGSSQQSKGDAVAHLQNIQTNLEQGNEEELRDRVRDIAKKLRNQRAESWTARMNAYIADETHPNLDPADKKTTKEHLALELRKNGVSFSSGASKAGLANRLTKHVQGTLSVTDYKSPRWQSLQATRRMPSLTDIIDIRGSKVLETQDEFLVHYNLFIAGLKHLYEQSSQLRRARFFERLSRSEGYNFTCDECPSTDSLHLVHDCGHMLCPDHLQNKRSCGEGSTLCTSPLGNFAVPIEELAVSSRDNDPYKDPQELSDDVKMSGTDEVTGTGMPGANGDGNGAQLDSKIRTVVELIQGKIPHDDKVVVFTQYDQILTMMVEQLNAHGISCHTTTTTGSRKAGSREASEVLESFKKGEFKALVMKQNSSEAAGGNLVVANHVIFVSPLVESSQHQYDAHMRQATGRCIREGQKKTVYVYHCITKGTIEANILELRQGKEIVVNRGEMLGELAESPHVGVPGGLCSTLSKAEVWRAMDEQDYNTTIGMKDGQVEFSI